MPFELQLIVGISVVVLDFSQKIKYLFFLKKIKLILLLILLKT